MTLAQFVFVALTLLPRFLSFRDGKTGSMRISLYHKAPLKEYVLMTLIFFVSSVASNKAFELGVSQPFNVIFRSLSLLVSYLIGMVWFNKHYSMRQFVAVALVTAGVMVTTLGELFLKSGIPEKLEQCCSNLPFWSQAYVVVTDRTILGLDSPTSSDSLLFRLLFFFGAIFLLSLTLIGLAVLGHLQGKVYNTYNAEPTENMFFLHLLPLPMFAILLGDLRLHWDIWTASTPYSVLGIQIPWLWWLCFCNAVTQVICLLGVHYTTSSMGTLVCTFATTVRKFISLIFSVLFFRNPFTPVHTAGALCVFVGTYLFATSSPVESTASASSSSSSPASGAVTKRKPD